MSGLGVISPLMPYYAGALDASGLVLGLIFAAFPLALGRGSILAFVPIFASTLAIGPTGVGILLFFHIFAIAALQIPCGEQADHGNRRGLVFTGSLVSSVALLFIPFSGDFISRIGRASYPALPF